MNDNAHQDAAALLLADAKARDEAIDIRHHVLAKAPAGSGKTSLLTLRALACLAAASEPEEVLCITFTNKASNEMRGRILQALDLGASGTRPEHPHEQKTYDLACAVLARDRELGWGLRENTARLRIMTIDALNSYLAACAPVVSGFGGSASVADQPVRLYREAVLSLVNELDSLATDDPLGAALARVMEFASNRVESLVPLLAAMLAKRDQWLPMIVELAGAQGTEADALMATTRSLVSDLCEARMRAIDASPWRAVLADIVQAGNIGGVWSCADLPAAHPRALSTWQTVAGVLLTTDGRLRARLNVKQGFGPKQDFTTAANEALAALHAHDLSGAVSAMLEELVALPDPTELSHAHGLAADLALVLRRACAHLAVVFQRNGEVDFLEVGMRASAALRGAGDAVPLAERLDYEIRHILLDEAQDTSASQFVLLQALIETWTQGDGRSLFIVGDPQQSIYMFREAEVRLFVELWQRKQIGNLPLKTLQLAANFRSRENIIRWCNDTFSRVFPAADDVFAGAVAYTPSVAMAGEGGEVRLTGWEGDAAIDEAEHIVKRIADLLANHPGESIAILVRSRRALDDVLPALKRAGIGYACQEIDLLTQTDWVRDVVGLIRALWHEGDRVAWGTVLRAPFVGLSWSDFLALTRGQTRGSLLGAARRACVTGDVSAVGRVRLERLVAAVDAVRRDGMIGGNLADMAEALWHSLGGPACVTPSQSCDVRQVFALLRDNMVAGSLGSPEDFDLALSKLYATPAAGPVDIMTVHRAKGLEFDHVIVAGLWNKGSESKAPLLAFRHLERGSILAPKPVDRDDVAGAALFDLVCSLNRTAEQAEDLRVLYVAMTRARKSLEITCAVNRDSKGEVSAPPNSLLSRLWPAVAPVLREQQLPVATPPAPHAAEPELLAPALPAGWTYPESLNGYRPADLGTVTPSELVVRDAIETEERTGTIGDRIVGILYHETMQLLCDRNLVARWDVLRERLRLSIVAGMRRRGMPEPRVAPGADLVLELVQRTLDCEAGRRIVAPRSDAQNEARVAGFVAGKWVSAIIDRLYPDEQGIKVVDYKTSGIGISADHASAFIESEVRKYEPAMRLYAEVVAAATCKSVKASLFFPALQVEAQVCQVGA